MNTSPLAALVWHAPSRLPGVAVLLVALLLAVWFFYQRQARTLRPRWRWVLRGLRLAALGALAISLLQPSALRPRTANEQGTLVILVDRSRSMGISDTQRSPAQLVALADGMGELPPGARTRAADAMVGEVTAVQHLLDDLDQAQTDFDFLALSGRSTQTTEVRRADAAAKVFAAAHALADQRTSPKIHHAPVVDRLTDLQHSLEKIERAPRPAGGYPAAALDALRPNLREIADASGQLQTTADDELYAKNSQVRAVCEELAHLSRLGLVEEALLRPETGLLAQLPAAAPVVGFSFDQTIAPVALRAGGGPVRQLSVQAGGQQTHLESALRAAMLSLKGVSVRAILLFSDGRDAGATPEARDEPALSSLLWSAWESPSDPSSSDQAWRVPIFTVAAAALSGPTEVSILHYSIPKEIFAGQRLSVHATLRGQRTAGNNLDVRFAVDGVTQTRHVVLGNDGRADVEFDVPPPEPGVHHVELSLGPLPGEAATASHAAVEGWVKVLGDKARILACAGSPNWDFRYLCDTLANSPWAEVRRILFDGGSTRLTMPPREILQQDIIILDDLNPVALDAQQWAAVRHRVAVGGGLVLIAGPDHLPADYPSDSPQTDLAELLPFVGKGAWKIWKGDDPVYRFVPASTLGADADPLLQLADDAASSRQRWETFPPVFRYWQMGQLKEDAQTLLVESESASPILVRRRLERGTVLFLGICETWRWRYKIGDRDQARFFEDLVHPLVPVPCLLGDGPLWLDVDPVAPEPGEPINLRARWDDAAASPPATIDLDVLQSGKPVHVEHLIPGICGYAATLPGLNAGDYDLYLHLPSSPATQPATGSATANAPSPAIHCPLHLAPNFSAELADVTGDRSALRRLATLSGGAALSLENVQTLPERLAALQDVPSMVEVPLWNSMYLFIFVVACLAAEWALRKGFGLA